MRYIDMKIMASAALRTDRGYNEQVHGTFARLAADAYVRTSAERKAQEIAGLDVPVAFIDEKLGDAGDKSYWVLIREDIFDAAVQEALASRNTLIEQMEEVLNVVQHRAVVPDTTYGDSRQEERICSSGGSDAVTQEDQLQGASS